MPKKVILHGDALKLLYTFLDYTEAYPDQMASVLSYDKQALMIRRNQLQEQVSDGVGIEWDDLDAEIAVLKEERDS